MQKCILELGPINSMRENPYRLGDEIRKTLEKLKDHPDDQELASELLEYVETVGSKCCFAIYELSERFPGLLEKHFSRSTTIPVMYSRFLHRKTKGTRSSKNKDSHRVLDYVEVLAERVRLGEDLDPAFVSNDPRSFWAVSELESLYRSISIILMRSGFGPLSEDDTGDDLFSNIMRDDKMMSELLELEHCEPQHLNDSQLTAWVKFLSQVILKFPDQVMCDALRQRAGNASQSDFNERRISRENSFYKKWNRKTGLSRDELDKQTPEYIEELMGDSILGSQFQAERQEVNSLEMSTDEVRNGMETVIRGYLRRRG